MKKILLTTLALTAYMSNAQTLYVPSGTAGIGTSTNTYVGIGTNAPTTVLEVKSSTNSATLRLGSIPTTAPATNSSIDFGSYGGTNNATYTSKASIGWSAFPACGSGQFGIGIANGANISMIGTGMSFNEPFSAMCDGSARYGDFNFKGLVGTRSLLVGNISNPGQGGTADLSLVSGYIFGINGGGYANKMVIGGRPTTTNFPMGFPTGYNLYVSGGILSERIKVSLKNSADWADYVFAKDYQLKSLDSVANYIQANKHLPDVPSAQEVVNEGIDVAKMDAKLLQKIEELTLYVININKKVDTKEQENQKEVAALKAKIEVLESENKALKK